jgi:hypothetical protein
MIMDRELKNIAPNAPGNFRPLLNLVIYALGALDEYLLQTPSITFI